jgi:hypothetical protein
MRGQVKLVKFPWQLRSDPDRSAWSPRQNTHCCGCALGSARYRRATCASSAEKTAQSPADDVNRSGIGAGRFAIRPKSGRDVPARCQVARSCNVSAGPFDGRRSSFFSAEGFFKSGLLFGVGVASCGTASSGGAIGAFLSVLRCCTGTSGFLASNVGSASFGAVLAGAVGVVFCVGESKPSAGGCVAGAFPFPERVRAKRPAPGSASVPAAGGVPGPAPPGVGRGGRSAGGIASSYVGDGRGTNFPSGTG